MNHKLFFFISCTVFFSIFSYNHILGEKGTGSILTSASITIQIPTTTAKISTHPKYSYPKIFYNGDPSSHNIALTFDDGPKEKESPALLDILDRFGIKATFFIVGKEAEANPDLVYRIYTSGHEIANHTYSHKRLDTLSNFEIKTEIQKTNEILENITDKKPKYFRPPGGRYNREILKEIKKFNLDVILWDVNVGDYIATDSSFTINGEVYSKNADRIYADVMKRIKKGSIVLLHNGGKETIKSLPQIINDLQKKGYKFVTLTELLYKKEPLKKNRDAPTIEAL